MTRVKSQIMLRRIPCLLRQIFGRDLQPNEGWWWGGLAADAFIIKTACLGRVLNNMQVCVREDGNRKERFSYLFISFCSSAHKMLLFFWRRLQEQREPKSKLWWLGGVRVCLGFKSANFSLFYSCRSKWQPEFLRWAARFDSERCHKFGSELIWWQAQIGSPSALADKPSLSLTGCLYAKQPCKQSLSPL